MRGFQRLYNIKSGNDLKLMVYLLLRRTGIRFCNSYSEALIVNLLISSSSAGEKITGARKKSAGAREKSAGDGKKMTGAGISFTSLRNSYTGLRNYFTSLRISFSNPNSPFIIYNL